MHNELSNPISAARGAVGGELTRWCGNSCQGLLPIALALREDDGSAIVQ